MSTPFRHASRGVGEARDRADPSERPISNSDSARSHAALRALDRDRTDQYANNRIEADHGRLKARLRPMRGLKRDHNASVVIRGHAFVQNLRRGHYQLGDAIDPRCRIEAAFDELLQTI